MGVVQLWAALAEYQHVAKKWSGEARVGQAQGDNAGIVAEVSGKVLAVDTSVWILQATQQRDLAAVIFDEHARVLYITIFRILNMLRYGITPVFVLEGDTPDAKMGRLQQRSLARGLGGAASGNRRGGRHDILGRRVVELLELLGLPYVEAPGEAEALCAALTAVGLADAAVTTDVDCLLFGATAVYRDLSLSMDTPRNNSLEKVEAVEAARRCFGLKGGGGCAQALQAVALLAGNDYQVEGGRGVGICGAMDAVQVLTLNRQDDSHVLSELLEHLDRPPDGRLAGLTKCNGCKTCGHEKHGRKPCPQCGPGACTPRQHGAACECEFHRTEPQRKFARTIARATATPDFRADMDIALAAFRSETQRATRMAAKLRRDGGALRWSRRPDVAGVYDLMHPLLGRSGADPTKLLWTYSEVRDKLRPVLLEWDMRQGPEPGAEAAAVVEFRPRRIKAVAAKDGGDWAYLMEFDRVDSVNAADAEFDRAQLASSKLVKGRHVRRRIVDLLWPHLLDQKEQEAQAKLAKTKKGRGKANAGFSPGGSSAATTTATGGGSAAAAAGGAGGRARGAAAAPARSGRSDGSSDVLLRFLQRPAAGATRLGPGGAAGGSGRAAAAAEQEGPAGVSGGGGGGGRGYAAAAAAGEEEEEEEEDMTQRDAWHEGCRSGGADGGGAGALDEGGDGETLHGDLYGVVAAAHEGVQQQRRRREEEQAAGERVGAAWGGRGPAAAAGAAEERLFRPNPTGPGPDGRDTGNGAAGGAAGGGAGAGLGHAAAGRWGAGGYGGGAAAAAGGGGLEVMDLTDSPAPVRPVAAAGGRGGGAAAGQRAGLQEAWERGGGGYGGGGGGEGLASATKRLGLPVEGAAAGGSGGGGGAAGGRRCGRASPERQEAPLAAAVGAHRPRLPRALFPGGHAPAPQEQGQRRAEWSPQEEAEEQAEAEEAAERAGATAAGVPGGQVSGPGPAAGQRRGQCAAAACSPPKRRNTGDGGGGGGGGAASQENAGGAAEVHARGLQGRGGGPTAEVAAATAAAPRCQVDLTLSDDGGYDDDDGGGSGPGGGDESDGEPAPLPLQWQGQGAHEQAQPPRPRAAHPAPSAPLEDDVVDLT